MINFHNQVPSIYTSASRDFQYMSWLINIVLNSVKHNVDGIYDLPDTGGDTKLTELLAMTLGFKVKRNYDKKQLTALVSILPSILKYKGTEKAINMAAEALVMASGSLGDPSVKINGAEIEVTLPKDLVDMTLFLDLLDYILPAGMTCRIIRKNKSKKTISNIELRHRDVLKVLPANDLDFVDNNTRSIGLSGLYAVENALTILGKAAISSISGTGIDSTNVTVNIAISNNGTNTHSITLTSPPIWNIVKPEGTAGIKLKIGDKYLTHKTRTVDGQVVPYVEFATETEATIWQAKLCGTAFRLSVTNDTPNSTEYYLAYNSKQQFCTSEYITKQPGIDIFDLYLYKEVARSMDAVPVYTYEALTDIESLGNTDNILIVVQGTPEFTANIKAFGDNVALNAGLLDNTVIPTLAGSSLVEVSSTAELHTTEYTSDGTVYTRPLVVAGGTTLRAEKTVSEF